MESNRRGKGMTAASEGGLSRSAFRSDGIMNPRSEKAKLYNVTDKKDIQISPKTSSVK